MAHIRSYSGDPVTQLHWWLVLFLFCLFVRRLIFFFDSPLIFLTDMEEEKLKKKNCEIYLGGKFASFGAELVSKSLR